MSRRQKRLWDFINGEPYLIDGEIARTPNGEPLFFGKSLVIFEEGARPQVFLDNPPVPFSRLRDNQYVQIDDIVRLRGCHRRTIARHIERSLLKVARRVGGEYFFTVGEVRRWIKSLPDLRRGLRVRPRVDTVAKPVSGRPKRKEGGEH